MTNKDVTEVRGDDVVEKVRIAIWDVLRKNREHYCALTITELDECAKAAIAAMANKHEKALAVARDALDGLMSAISESDVTVDFALNQAIVIADKALATVDEIMGK